jgi:membrane-associated phospholipid phosphatase
LAAGTARRVAAIHFPEAAAGGEAPGHGPLRFVALELLVWTSLYGLYLAVRGLSIASANEAVANARSIVDVERALGLFQEARLQNGLAALDEALSLYYLLGFAPLLVGVLAWLGLRHREIYRELRSLLLISIALAVIVHVALPVAPPRLVPELGIADTVGLDRDGSSFAGIPYNPYAAMPSMHVGWSLLVGLLALQASKSVLVRTFFVVHPAVMAIAVTATGNHYFLDSLAGALVALAGFGTWRLVPAIRTRLAIGPQPACARC